MIDLSKLKEKRCPICGASFHKRLSLARHIEWLHPSEDFEGLPAMYCQVYGEPYPTFGWVLCKVGKSYLFRYQISYGVEGTFEVPCYTVFVMPKMFEERLRKAKSYDDIYEMVAEVFATAEERALRTELKRELRQLYEPERLSEFDHNWSREAILLTDQLARLHRTFMKRLWKVCSRPPDCKRCSNFLKCALKT